MLKVVIKPTSPYITELKSSTLFGFLMCAISSLYDPEIIQLICEDGSKFVVSDAFPSGYLPDAMNNGFLVNKEGHRIKSDEVAKKVTVHHNQINRDTGISDGCRSEVVSISESNFDVYLDFYAGDLFTIDNIRDLLSKALKLGIGKGRSRGLGQFKLVSVEEVELPSLVADGEIPTGYMVLSDYIPEESDSTIGRYSIRVINSITSDGQDRGRYRLINSGSVFKGVLSDNSVGQIVKDKTTGTYLSGKALVMPIVY